MIAPLLEDIPYAVFFAKVLLSDELDLKATFFGNPLGIVAQLISKRFGKAGVVKDADMVVTQKTGHPLSIAEGGKCPLDHHSIKTGENSQNLVGVAVRQERHGYPTPP